MQPTVVRSFSLPFRMPPPWTPGEVGGARLSTRLEPASGFMVYGLWFMVYGLWFMVYGLWFMVYDL